MSVQFTERDQFLNSPQFNRKIYGYHKEIDVAIGGTEILKIPPGMDVTVYAYPASGGTATIEYTGLPDKDVASATADTYWIDSGQGGIVAKSFAVIPITTGLRLKSATNTSKFYILLTPKDRN